MGKAKENLKKKFSSLREKKGTATVYFLFRGIVLLLLILNVLGRNYENVFVCFLALTLFVLPFMIEEKFEIEVPSALHIIILCFIFAAQILGELNAFYLIFPNWDMILHTINGFIMGAIGVSLIDLLNKSERIAISLTPFFVVFFAFCFSMTTGVLWEFLEFGMDRVLKTDTQKDTYINQIVSVDLNDTVSNKAIVLDIDEVTINGEVMPGYLDIGLIDTMEDMIVNFIGAVFFCVIGFFRLKSEEKREIDSLMIRKRVKPKKA